MSERDGRLPPTPSMPPPSMRVRYRMGQFVRGLFAAGIDAEEAAMVAELLPDAAVRLFAEMPPDAQRHSINVLETLFAAGYADPDLAAAALFHDVGKVEAARAGVGINLWMRGPLVMAEAIAPATLKAQASSTTASGWRYALYVHFDHPRIGADWARVAGCSELTCWLVEHHQDVVDDADMDEFRYQLLAALQWADEFN